MDKLNKFLKNDVLLALIFPATSYLASYGFEKGYLNAHGLPDLLISLTLESMVPSTMILIFSAYVIFAIAHISQVETEYKVLKSSFLEYILITGTISSLLMAFIAYFLSVGSYLVSSVVFLTSELLVIFIFLLKPMFINKGRSGEKDKFLKDNLHKYMKYFGFTKSFFSKSIFVSYVIFMLVSYSVFAISLVWGYIYSLEESKGYIFSVEGIDYMLIRQKQDSIIGLRLCSGHTGSYILIKDGKDLQFETHEIIRKGSTYCYK